MSFLNKLRPGIGRERPTDAQAASTIEDTEIQVVPATTDAEGPDDTPPEKVHGDAVPSQDAQLGVQKVEAVTLAWSKRWLAALLIKSVSVLAARTYPSRAIINRSPTVSGSFSWPMGSGSRSLLP